MGAAGVLKPLRDALLWGQRQGGQVGVVHTDAGSFRGQQAADGGATHLAHPGRKAILALSIDASGTLVGAALQQERPPGSLQPLGFFLQEAEHRGAEVLCF